MVRKVLQLLAASGAACFLLPAAAQPQGGYAGAGVVYVSTDNARDFAATFLGPGGSGDGSATGFKLFGGYIFPRGFGVEGGYYDLGTYDVTYGGVKTDQFKVSALTAAGTVGLSIGPRLDGQLKAGFAFTNVEYTCVIACGGRFFSTSDSGVAGLLAGGLGWSADDHFSVRGDFEYFSQVPHKVGALQEAYFHYATYSLSAQYRF